MKNRKTNAQKIIALTAIAIAINAIRTEAHYYSACGRIWMAATVGIIPVEKACELVEAAAKKLHEKDAIDKILDDLANEIPDHDDPDYLASLQKQAESELAEQDAEENFDDFDGVIHSVYGETAPVNFNDPETLESFR